MVSEAVVELVSEATLAMQSGDRQAILLAWTRATGMLDRLSPWTAEEEELIRGEQRALLEALAR